MFFMNNFLSRMLGHVTRTGYQTGFAFYGFIAGRQQFCCKITNLLSGGLRANIAAAPLQTLAGQYSDEFIELFLIQSTRHNHLACNLDLLLLNIAAIKLHVGRRSSIRND
jgi:hypothetical protein